MAVVNGCFKGVFIFFNVLFGIAGVLILGLGIFGHAFYHPSEGLEHKMSGVLFLYLIGGPTLALSILGIYGAYKEKKWALIVFFTGMVLGSIGLLLISITVSVGMPMAIQGIEKVLYDSIPLDEARSDIQMMFNKLQPELKCCGAFNGYQDWGKHVPDSCLCSSDADRCEKINGSQSALDNDPGVFVDVSKNLVYKEPCGPIVISYMQTAFNTILGICIGFAVLAFIGMVISMTMICQIRRRSSPVTFRMDPSPPYTVLHNAMEA
ncbi:tetraspanin-8-like [Anguilla rostrata]|uniref:tetraspanin-8-like n=1 Tax=Anguilla rostrata TaxID=7938 RepID=UPI0030CDDBAB